MFTSKVSLLFNLAVLLTTDLVLGQDASRTTKVKVYDALVKLSTQRSQVVGILKEARDSSVLIVVGREDVNIPVGKIEKISIKRKGNVGRGALRGMLVGSVIGGVAGYTAANGDSCDGFCMSYSPTENTVIGAMVGSGIGAIIGMFVGRIRADAFLIGGSREEYNRYVPLLRTYSLSQDD